MNRSTCASGSGYVPSVSIGFCVAITRNGSGTQLLSPAIVTWRSCITSSNALCTFAGLLVVDARSHQIRRDEIWRELNSFERAADGSGERLDSKGFCEPRYALDEQVSLRQDGHQHALQKMILADDDLLHLVKDALHE